MKTILSWDKYFMALAKVSALRSKDPNTQVGAVIVNSNKRAIAMGYNGMPQGNDKDFPWTREAEEAKDTKYPYVIHAELNAILNATTSVQNGTLYVTLFPCSACAKMIVQSGITRLVYTQDLYKDTDDNDISKEILRISGVATHQIDDFDVNIT